MSIWVRRLLTLYKSCTKDSGLKAVLGVRCYREWGVPERLTLRSRSNNASNCFLIYGKLNY